MNHLDEIADRVVLVRLGHARQVPQAAPDFSFKTVLTTGALCVVEARVCPGYMKAMTMMFEVEKPDLLNDIKVEDQVSFTFSDRDGRLYIESISKGK